MSVNTRPIAIPSTQDRYRWVMLGAIWLIYASFGLVSSSIAPILTPIREELGLSRGAMGLLLGTWALVYIGAAIPAGAVLDRFGTRRGLAIGIALIVASGFARAAAVDFPTMFLAIAIFGLGGPLLSVGSPKLISQWFPKKERPVAIGIYITGPATGSVAALTLANSVVMPLTGDSWRLTLAVFAAVALATAVVWLALAKDPVEAPAAAGSAPGEKGLRPFLTLARVPVVLVMLAMAVLQFLHGGATNNWLPDLLKSGGETASRAGLMAAIPTAVGIVLALTVPRFSNPSRRMAMLTTSFACMAAAPLLVVAGGSAILPGLLLLGFGRVVVAQSMEVLMDAPRVSAANMGAAGGLFFTAGEIGGVLGPTIMGAMADASGDFRGGLVVLTVLGGVLVLLTFVLRFLLKRSRVAAEPVAGGVG